MMFLVTYSMTHVFQSILMCGLFSDFSLILLTKICWMQLHLFRLQSDGFGLFISSNLSCATRSVPACLSVYISTHPPTHPPIHPSIHPSTHQPMYPSISQPTDSPNHTPTHLPAYVPTYLPSTHPLTYLPACLSENPYYENSVCHLI
jgi:hypothetical protein